MYQISDTVERKFVDSVEVSDWEIETEAGWVDITHINKTVEYDVYQLTTTSTYIECADNHIVFRADRDEVFVKDLQPGDPIIGQYGTEYVISVVKTNRKEHMFDISVGGNHTFYAEGLLHHNTTVSAAYFVWYVIFNDSKSVAIMANKQATAYEIMDRFRLAYENLPKWLQQGVETWNRGSVVLENGSKVFGAATTSSGTRGKTVNILYLDEFAFVDNNIAESFFTAVFPTISAGKDSKVFMTSTPNGFNHFYKFWNDAQKGTNGFFPLRIHWYETPGRDQAWYETQKAALGELKAAQELDAEFLGSSRQLLTASTMNRLTYIDPIKEFDDLYAGMRVYINPVKEHAYVITVDVSRGRHLDSSAFIVWDVTQYPFRISATYNNNEISPMMYTNIVQRVARMYNEAYLLVEINDVGAQVANDLYYEFEYENQFWTKSGDQLGKKGADPYPGIRTTKKTKRIGCANFKDMIEKNQIIIDDYLLINQLSTFVQADSGVYAADDGFHDDMVMCGVLFAWLLTQPWFRDLTDKDIRLNMYERSINAIEEELVPFGFINDGQTEYEEVITNF